MFNKNRSLYEIIWKNNVEPDRPQMTKWHIRISCRIPKATDTHTICNTYCFFTAKLITRTRLNIAFTRTWTVLFIMTTDCVPYVVGSRCLMTVV